MLGFFFLSMSGAKQLFIVLSVFQTQSKTTAMFTTKIKSYFSALLITILTSFSFGQGYQITALIADQNSYLVCDSSVELSMSVYQSTNYAGADINFGVFGSSFSPSQFEVNVEWGDGDFTDHYGGTSNYGTPIPFNPPMEHVYPGVGAYTMVVTVTNPQNNTTAVDTVNVTVQQCATYIYASVGIDCNNDGTNETTLSQGVPITITSTTNQYSDTTISSMANISGVVPGNYVASIDSFWLNSNGYMVDYVSGGGNFTVFSNTTTYTVQFTLICDTNTTIPYQCISGYVFCDASGNGIFDGSESAVANAPVNVQGGGQNYTATRDASRIYSLTYAGPNGLPSSV